MAKKQNNDGRSSKMMVMFFQLEGDDATLQEGCKTISNAISRVLSPGPNPYKTDAALDAITEFELNDNGD